MPFRKKSIDYSRSTIVKKSGFTLIELLITITIIGILSSIVTYGIVGQQRKARDAQRKSDMQTFKKAMESAKADCRNAAFYPRRSGSGSESTRFIQTHTLHLTSLKYLPAVLADPKNNDPYYYRISWTESAENQCPDNISQAANARPGTQTWVARAMLETTNDPDRLDSYNNCSNQIAAVIAASGYSGTTPPSSTDNYFYVCSS